jgi:hypothetical protein
MSVVVTPIITATKAEWMATTQPIVQNRVLYETDTGNYKIGDGSSIYSALSYATNISTFTNYVFMVPLDDLGSLFVEATSGSSSFQLWAPGVPAMTSVVGANITPQLAQNATTLPTGSTSGLMTVTCAENPGKVLQFAVQGGNLGGQQFGALQFPVTLNSNGEVDVLMNANLLIQLMGEGNGQYGGSIIGVGFSDGTNAIALFHQVTPYSQGDALVWIQGGFVEPTSVTEVDSYPYSFGTLDSFASQLLVSMNDGVRLTDDRLGMSTVYSFANNSEQYFNVSTTRSGSPSDAQQTVSEQTYGSGGNWLDTSGQIYFCILFGDFINSGVVASTTINIFELQTSGFSSNLPKAPGY